MSSDACRRLASIAPGGIDAGAARAQSGLCSDYLRALRRRTRRSRRGSSAWSCVFLILWEVAPRAGWINPMLTSYPSAVARNLHDAARGWHAAGSHTWVTFSSTVIGFAGGMVIGHGLRGRCCGCRPFLYRVLDPVHRRAQRAAEDRAGADLLHLARRRHVDLRHGHRRQRLHHDPDAVYGISGHRSGQDQAGAAVRCLALEVLTKIVLPGSVPDHDLHAEGQCRPRSGRRGRRRIPGRQGRAWTPHHLWQPDLSR